MMMVKKEGYGDCQEDEYDGQEGYGDSKEGYGDSKEGYGDCQEGKCEYLEAHFTGCRAWSRFLCVWIDNFLCFLNFRVCNICFYSQGM